MKAATGPEKSVRLRFRNPRYDRIIRINTEAIARKMGFDEEQIFDISLAVEEAYANAIEHSQVAIVELELEIQYRLFDDRLEVSVQDSGCGFDRDQVDRRPSPEASMEDRGRGLGLIRSLSDEAEILSAPGAGTLIRIVKFLQNETEEEPAQAPRPRPTTKKSGKKPG